MSIDSLTSIISSLQKMETEWHRIFGLEGNYYFGNEKVDLLISFITFKRVCDICKEQYEQVEDSGDIDFKLYSECYITGSCQYDYKESWSWEHVTSQGSPTEALKEAIDGINTSNYVNIGYGDNLIPLFHFSCERIGLLDQVLLSWAKILDNEKLGKQKLSEEKWLAFSKMLRTRKIR